MMNDELEVEFTARTYGTAGPVLSEYPLKASSLYGSTNDHSPRYHLLF